MGWRWVRRLAVDVSPLRASRDFRLIFIGQLISLAGRQITIVAVPYQIYLLTHSSVAVGALGAVQLVPYVIFSLVAGTIADRVDRRKLLLVTQVLLTLMSALFVAGAIEGHPPLLFLYGVAALAAGISAVDQPARSATIPNLVRREHLPGALSLNFALFETAAIAGPAVGGVIIGRVGLALAYGIDVATFGAAILAVLLISPQIPSGQRRESPVEALVAGFQFLWATKVILGGYALDLNAMVLSLPRALFPALALSLYHAGASGLGVLYSATGVGAVAGSFLSGFIRHLRYPGRAVLFSVAGWGAAISALGLAGASLWLAVGFLALAGAADAISAISRNTIQQTLAPDRLRGRLSAVGSMVVVGGPYLGDARAGAVSGVLPPQLAILVGGLSCLAGCAVIRSLIPQLWHFDIVEATVSSE